ncbi:MAG: hypothetical protein U0Q19_06685 [Kineosporiaceae bacterium]
MRHRRIVDGRRPGDVEAAPAPRETQAPTGFRLTVRSAAAVLAVLAALVGLLAGTSWGREQVRLSATRVPVGYWELYLENPTVTCPTPGSEGRLTVTSANPSDVGQQVAWTAQLVGPARVARPLGALAIRLDAGRSVRTPVRYQAPDGAYQILVRGADGRHQLTVGCEGVAR